MTVTWVERIAARRRVCSCRIAGRQAQARQEQLAVLGVPQEASVRYDDGGNGAELLEDFSSVVEPPHIGVAAGESEWRDLFECAAGLPRRFRPAADDPGRLCANARAADHGALRRAELVHYIRQPARESADLRIILRRVGHSGDLASKIRDSLLGIGRIVPYASSLAADWLPPEIKPRLDTVRQDLLSLSDYDAHIVNKVQLLLDATLGLINVEQNNIIKVLTIVSVVGIPPTLIASMYGMNFKGIPEYDWSWGYPYGLALIALSAILPLIWFKLRGWI
jgi:hypothetical protein